MTYQHPCNKPYLHHKVASTNYKNTSIDHYILLINARNNFPKRTAFLWVITQRVVVISYRRFGTTYRSLLQGTWTPEDET